MSSSWPAKGAGERLSPRICFYILFLGAPAAWGQAALSSTTKLTPVTSDLAVAKVLVASEFQKLSFGYMESSAAAGYILCGSHKHPCAGATVVLNSATDGVPLGSAKTTAKGWFDLRKSLQGADSYVLTTACIGSTPLRISVKQNSLSHLLTVKFPVTAKFEGALKCEP